MTLIVNQHCAVFQQDLSTEADTTASSVETLRRVRIGETDEADLRHHGGGTGQTSRPGEWASGRRLLSLCLLVSILSACTSTDLNPEARPLDMISMNQCQRVLDALKQRLDRVKERIAAGSTQEDVLEELQQLRQDVPAAESKCVASKAATQEVRSIDEELEEIELRLTMEGYR